MPRRPIGDWWLHRSLRYLPDLPIRQSTALAPPGRPVQPNDVNVILESPKTFENISRKIQNDDFTIVSNLEPCVCLHGPGWMNIWIICKKYKKYTKTTQRPFSFESYFQMPSQKFPVFEMPIELSSSIRSRDGRICFKASALKQTFGFSCDKQIPCGKPQCGRDEDRVTELLELFM